MYGTRCNYCHPGEAIRYVLGSGCMQAAMANVRLRPTAVVRDPTKSRILTLNTAPN